MNKSTAAPTTAVIREPISPPARDTDQAEQEAADDCADDPDHHVAEQSEAATAHQHAGKPAGDGADDQRDDEVCWLHDRVLSVSII